MGAGDDLAAVALAKLQSAHELLMASPGGKTRQTRMAYHLGALMAREHLVAQNPAAARSMLLSVAGARSCISPLLWDLTWSHIMALST